jgi:hypothetical protein
MFAPVNELKRLSNADDYTPGISILVEPFHHFMQMYDHETRASEDMITVFKKKEQEASARSLVVLQTVSASPAHPHSLSVSPVSAHACLLAHHPLHHHPLHPPSYSFSYITLYATPILLLCITVPRDVVMHRLP